MLLTIIIPVYNVERYISKCIESCLAQNLDKDNYEIIFINDGTPDKAMDIVGRYTELGNIKIFNQSNQGLSAARNKGLKYASGEYIWFVDSDDWIEENCLTHILRKLQSDSPDVLMVEAAKVENEIITPMYHLEERIDNGIDALRAFIYACAPFYIFKRSFLKEKKFEFKTGIFHEDMELIPRILYTANKVSYLSKICYYYMVQNPNSITNICKPKRSYDYLNVVCRSLYNFSEKLNGSEKKIFNIIITQCINNAITNMKYAPEKDKNRFIELFFENFDIVKRMFYTGIIKYRIECIFLCIFPKFTIRLYQKFA